MTELQDQSPYSPERPPLGRRLLAAVTAGTFAAGLVVSCEALFETTQPERDETTIDGPTTPADTLARITETRDQLVRDITAEQYDFVGLRETLREEDYDDKQLIDDLMHAVDLKDAGAAVDTASYAPEQAAEDAADIVDPDLRQEALSTIHTQDALEKADSALNSYILGPEDAAEARAAFVDLPEAVKTLYEHDLDTNIAKSAITHTFDFTEARVLADLIQDAALREQTHEAINAQEATRHALASDYSEYNRLSAEESDKLLAIHEIARQSDAALREQKQLGQTDEADKRYTDAAEEILDRVDAETTQIIRDHNKLDKPSAPKDALDALPTPTKRLDFTGIETDKTVTIEADGTTTTYREFAQAFVEGGELKFKTTEGAKLPKDTVKELRAIFERTLPLLEAGYGSGDIVSTRFVFDADFSESEYSYGPLYDTRSREIVMVVPTDRSVTVDQFASGLIHESVHALARSAMSRENVTVEEADAIRAACTAVKDASYNNLERAYTALPEHLAALKNDLKTKHKPIVDKVLEAVNNSTLEKFLSYDSDYMDEYGISINDCTYMTLGDLLYTAAQEANIELEPDELTYLADSVRFAELSDEWKRMDGAFNLFNKFNESAFVDTQSDVKEYLGHSQENADEMVASLTDAMISYGPLFCEEVANMTDEEKQATILAVRASVDLLSRRHPSLIGMLSEYEADVLVAANQ